MLSKLLGKIIGKKNTKKLKKTVQKTVKKVENTAKNIFSGSNSTSKPKATPIKRTTTNSVAKPKASDLVTRKKVDSERSTTNSTPLYSPKKDYTSNIKKPNYSPKEEILKNIQNKSKSKDKIVPIKKNKGNAVGYVAKKTGLGALRGTVGIGQAGLTETAKGMKQGSENKKASNIIKNILNLNPITASANAVTEATKNALKKDNKKIGKKIVNVGLDLADSTMKPLNAENQLVGMVAPKNSYKKVLKMNEKISKPIDKLDKKLNKEASKYSKKVQNAGQVADVVGNMLPSIAVSLATKNANIGLATMGAGAKGTSTMEALRNGESLERATKIGTLKGDIEVGTELLSGGLKGFGGGVLDDVAEKGISKVTNKISGKGLTKIAKVVNKTLNLSKDVAGEITEETISDVLDTVIDKNTYNPNAKYSFEDWKETAGITTASTIVLNILTHGAVKGLNKVGKIDSQQAQRLNVSTSEMNKAIAETEKRLNVKLTDSEKRMVGDVVTEQLNKTYETENNQMLFNQILRLEQNNKQIEEKKTQATLLNNNLKNKTNTTQNVAETQAQIDTLVNEIQQLKNTNAQINQEIQSNPQFRQIEALNLTMPEIQQLASGNLDINEKLQQVKEMQPYTAENPAITIPKQKGTRNYKIQETLYQIEQNMTPELLSQKLNIEEIENTSYDLLDRIANIYISAKQSNLNNSVDTNGTIIMLAKIAEDKGYNIIFNSNLASNENGRIVPKNGVTTIELNPNSVRSTEFILMHELTHAVGTKEIWQDIIDYAKADSKVAKMLNDKIKAYQEQTDYTDEEIQEEVMCDMMGELLGSQEYINHLSQEKPTLFEKILKWLNDFLGRTNKNSYEHEYLSKIKADFESTYNGSNNLSQKNEANVIQTFKNAKNTVDRQIVLDYSDSLNIKIKDGAELVKNTNMSNLAGKNKTPSLINIDNLSMIVNNNNRIEIRKSILDKFIKRFNKKEIKIIDTGTEAEIRKKGIEKTLSGAMTTEKVDSMNKLDQIIENGLYKYTTTDTSDPNGILYHHFITPVEYNGNNEVVRTIIKEYPKNSNLKDKYYYHQMEFLDSKKTDDSTLYRSKSEYKAQEPSVSIYNIPQNSQKVNSGISNNSNMQNKEKDAVKNSIELDDSSFSNTTKYSIEPTMNDEQIAKILDRGSTKNISFKEDMRRKLAITTANVIDKGYYIEKLARKTGNSRLDALYDNTLFSSSQAQEIIGNGRFEVNTPQKIGLKATLKTKKGVASTETKVGDSLYDIYEPIENSGKQKEFEEYMYHKLNVERMTLDKRYGEENKKVFAESIGADKSREFIKKIEAKNPEFKEWAKKVYEYESNDKYSDMATLVESGIMSKEQAEYLKEKYPSYVPIIRDIEHKQIDNMINGKKITVKTPVKKAKGGNQNMIPLKEAMAIKTLMVQRSANMNKLGLELMKTLNPEVTEQEMSADKVLEEMTNGKEMFTERNGLPTMSVFENGVKKTFEIPEEIYLALKPMNADSPLNWTLLPTNKLSNLKRSVLTEYNVYFMLRNIVKDTQDVVLNSKHPVKTMAKFPEAMAQLAKKGYWYKEMEKQGIFNNSFFDGQKKFDPYMKKDGKVKTILKMPLTAIATANNFVERIPRVAEYIASREAGYSVEEASLHSQRVTTNFKAGGQLTKFFNRNVATFLNAGVQGLQQQARNIQEANAEGLKGYLKLASKVAVVSSPVLVALLNNMLFGDDDDYEKTSDHEKNNYYFIAKYGDGNFIKIPRGRMAGVIQNVERQLIDLSKGKDKFDLDEAWDLFVNNVAPSNPLKSNIFSPFIDTKLFNKNDPGKTWYGEDLVPKSLQGDGTKAKDEYDEGTDKFSIWLGDKLNLSPIKINNLIDQNTGIIGDIILPLLTLETKTSTSNPLIAPLESAFTSDRVYDNKYPSMLYSMKDELEEKAKDKGLTQEDKAKQQYLNSISSEAYSYYNKIKSIQSSTTMTKNKKYEEVRKVREQMNAMIEDRLKGIDKITTSSNYSEVGEGKNKKYFYKNYKGNYTEVKEKELAKLNKTSMSLKDKDEYFKTKVELSQYMYNTKDKNKYTNAYKMILNSKTSQEGKAILYNNNSGFWSKDPTPLASVGLVDGFLKVESKGLKSDYKNGKVVRGSKQNKIINAVNKLEGYSATEKAMIVKTYYNKYNNYDNQILNYIDNKKMDSSKKKALLESLGFKVSKNNVSSGSRSKITPYKSGSKRNGTKKTTSKKKSTKSVSVPRKKVTPIKISTSSKSANTFKVGTKKNNNKKVYQNALKLLLKK